MHRSVAELPSRSDGASTYWPARHDLTVKEPILRCDEVSMPLMSDGLSSLDGLSAERIVFE